MFLSAEDFVNAFAPENQYYPDITHLEDGSYILVWQSEGQDGDEYAIVAQRFAEFGAPVGTESIVNTTTTGGQERPRVTDVSGGYVVTWQSPDGSGNGVYGQLYDLSGAKVGTEFLVNTEIGSDQYQHDVSGLPDGGFVVTFYDEGSGTGYSDDTRAQIFDNAGAKVGTPFVVNTYGVASSSNQGWTAVTAIEKSGDANQLTNGGFVAVYSSGDNKVYAQRYAQDGTAFGTEIDVTGALSSSYSETYRPAVAGLSDGQFVVVFVDNSSADSSGAGIFANVYNGDGSLVTVSPIQINFETSSTQYQPAVTGLSDGTFAVVWSSNTSGSAGDGSSYGVFARVFAADGTALSDETQVNATTLGNQSRPEVTALADGSFAVTWHSENVDGDGYAVMHRILGDSALFVGGSANPELEAVSATRVFAENTVNAAPQLLDADGAVALSDADSADFDGGRLVVSVIGWSENEDDFLFIDAAGQDVLGIDQSGTVSISGSTVSVGGTVVGTVTSDGTGGSDLIVSFTTGATSATIEVLIEALTYQNLSDDPRATTTVAIAVEDGDGGGSGGTSIEIQITPEADAEGAVTGDRRSNSYTTNDQDNSAIAGLVDGGYMSVWTSYLQDGSTDGVFGQRYDANGNAIGSEFQVNTTTSSSQNDAAVTGLSDGGWAIVWHDNSSIKLNRYEVDGTLSVAELQVETFTSSTQYQPDIAEMSDGDIVVTWSSYTADGSLYGISAQRFTSAGVPVDGEITVNDQTIGSQTDSRVTALADGAFMVVWTEQDVNNGDGDSYSIRARIVSSAGALSPAADDIDINSFTASTQQEPTLTTLANGNVVVTWSSHTQDGDSYGTYFRILDASGTALTDEIRANEVSSYDQQDPAIIALSTGGFVIAWEDYNYSTTAGWTWDAHAQIFTEDGARVDGTVLLNESQNGTQVDVALAALPDGNWVAQFTSNSGDEVGDSSGNSVIHRIFGDAGEIIASSAPVVFGLNDLTVTETAAEAGVAVFIDGVTAISDSDSADFDGGSLTISRITTEGADSEFLAPDNDAQDNFVFAAVNGVSVAGSTISVNGTGVATIDSDGQNGAALELSLLPGATIAAVEALLSALRYVNDSHDPSETRTFSFLLADGDGGATAATEFDVTINAETEADAPVAVTDDILVNSYTDAAQNDPEIGALSDGGWVVVWTSDAQDSNSSGVFGQRYNADGSLSGGEFRIAETFLGAQSDPVVTGLDNGGFAVSWSGNGTGDSSGVFARVYDVSGAAVTGETLVNTNTSSGQVYPSIVAVAGGYAVSWTSQSSSDDGNGYAVLFQRFDNAGAAQGSATLAYSGAGTDSTQQLSDMAQLSNGNFVITWASNGQDGSNYGVYASIFDATGVLQGTEFLVNTATSGSQTDPSVAATADGGFVVAWNNQSGASSYDVYAQRFDASGTAQGGEFRVNDETSGSQYQPDVIGLSDGRFVVAFYEGSYALEPDYYNVGYQLYSATGARLDGNVRINSQTNGTQSLPALAALPDGNFVATWQSTDTGNSEDTSSGGVYQKIFGNPADFDLSGAPLLQGVETQQTVDEADVNAGLVHLFDDRTIATGDLDSADFDGGVLRVSFENASEDFIDPAPGEGLEQVSLALISGNVGNGVVSVSGTAVSVDGTVVGTISEDGQAGNAFAVTFNTNATVEAVEAVIGALGLSNNSDDPADWMRFALNLSDGDGNSAKTELITVNFTPETDSTLIGGDESRVNSYADSTQYEPVIAELTGGGHVVIWTTYQDETYYYDVRAQMYAADGAPVGQEFTVNTTTSNHQYARDVASTADGGFVVVYEGSDLDTNGYGIAAQRFNADGTLNGGEFVVSITETGTQSEVRVSGFVDGGFVATWSYNGEIFTRVFDAAGNGGVETQVNTTVTSSTQNTSDVATLVDGLGDNAGFAVVFTDHNSADGDAQGVYLALYDAVGSKIGADTLVNTYTNSNQNEPKVTGLADGGFVVTWTSNGQDGDNQGIYAQMYDTAGAKLGDEFRVNETTYHQQYDSDVTAMADGGFVITWYDAGVGDVKGQRYTATGAKIDDEFIVNENISSTQYQPSVTSSGSGFAVVWASNDGTDGSGDAVKLREFGTTNTDTSPVMTDLDYSVSLGADDVTAGPMVIDGSIGFSDPDTSSFAGGMIDVYHVQDNAATDQLGLDASGMVSITGLGNDEVRVDGVQVGTIDAALDGVNGNDLRITLLAAADPAAVEILLESLSFASTDTAANIANSYRGLGILVTDGTGGQTEPDAIRIDIPAGSTAPTGFSGITDWDFAETTFSETALIDAPVLIDTKMALTDVAGASYSGGYVRLQDNYYGDGGRQFTIRDEGTGTGQIGLSGSDVTYGGTVIGTINATYDGDQQYLQVDLGANATTEAVEELIENLQFQYVTFTGQTLTRLALTVSNGSIAQSASSFLYNNSDYALAEGATTEETQVNLTTYQAQEEPMIAALNDGSYVVVWSSNYQDVPDTYGYGVYGRLYSAEGQPLSGEIQINDLAAGEQTVTSVTTLSNGNFVVSWTDANGRDGSGYGVFAQVMDTTGQAVGGAIQINEEFSSTQYQADIAATSAGSFVAIWSSQTSGSAGDGSSYGVFGRVFGTDGATPGSEFQINTTTSGNQTTPQAATLANGDIIVVWEDQSGTDGSGYGIFAQRMNASGALLSFDGTTAGADETQINTYTNSNQSAAEIVALDGGGFVVAWVSSGQDGSGEGVYAQVYDASGMAVGTEIQVNQYEDSTQNQPTLVGDGAGGFYVVWTDDSSFSSGADIVARRFDAGGTDLGDQFTVNEQTSSTQHQSSAALLSNGALAVAWASQTSGDAGDGSSYGVFQTLLNQPAPGAGALAPVVDGFDDTVNFVESAVNAGLQLLDQDGALSITDSDSTDFDGGYLILSNNSYGDEYSGQLGANDGNAQHSVGIIVGAGVTLSGSDVLVDGIVIGTIDATRNGVAGEDLRIDFIATATPEAVERVTAQMGYANSSDNPDASRLYTLTLTDGDGGGTSAQLTVNVTAETDSGIVPVGDEEQVNSYIVNAQNTPESAAVYDVSGTQIGYVTVWDSYNQDAPYTGYNGIFAQIFALDGSPIGPEFLVTETTINSQSEPAVIGLPTGGFAVGWTSGSEVWTRSFDETGTAVSGEIEVSDLSSTNQSAISLASKADGTIVVAYTDNSGADGSGSGVYLREFSAVGVPAGASILVNDETLSTQTNASVTVLTDGQTVVTWESNSSGGSADGNGYGVFAKIYADDGSVAVAEFQVNINSSAGQREPVITALSDGGFVIAFTDQDPIDGSSYSVWQQKYAADGSLVGDQVRVNETTSSTQYEPNVTALDGGGWIVVWRDDGGNDGSGTGIFAQIYDASGHRVDGEFQVNTEFSSTQYQATVVALPGGGFTISWASITSGTAGDGDNYGVFQQVYGPTGTPISADPVISGMAATLTISEADANAGTALFPALGVGDSDSADFDGGALTLYMLTDPSVQPQFGAPDNAAQDSFSLPSSGPVMVSGNSVSVDGTVIGTLISDGQAGIALSIAFNGNATANAIEALMEAVSYTNESDDPVATRYLQVVLTDGDGGASTSQTVVTITPETDGLEALGNEAQTNSYTQNAQSSSANATLSDGSYVVVWYSEGQDGSSTGVFGQLYDASGAPAGPEIQINTTASSSQQYPSVVGLDTGGFAVAWSDYSGQTGDDNDQEVVYRIFDANGTATTGEIAVDAGDDYNPDTVSLTAFTDPTDGTFLISYEANDSSTNQRKIASQVVNDAGGFVGTGFDIEPVGASDTGTPDAATMADGTFIVTYVARNLDNTGANDWGVYMQRYAADRSAIGAPILVNAYVDSTQADPAIAALENGTYVVSWSSNGQDGSGEGVYVRLFDASGTALGDESLVNETVASTQYQPDVVGIPGTGGGFAVTYADASADGSGYGVMLQQYDASGNRVDDPILVNEYTNSTQYEPAITALPNGSLVVSYSSYGPDGDDYGIYHRIIGDPATVSANADPVLGGVNATVTYEENVVNAIPQLIDANGAAAVSDSDSADFDGGSLIVSSVISATALIDQINAPDDLTQDQYGLRQGARITITGTAVSVDGTTVATIAQTGTGGAPFELTLNSNASAEIVELLVENLTYRNISDDPIETRNIRIQLTDGDGGASDPVLVEVTITPNQDAAGARGGEQQANTTDTGTEALPEMVGLPGTGGDFVMVWYSNGDILGQRFDNLGNKLDRDGSGLASGSSDEFVVTAAANTQTDPKIAAFSDGSWIVVWEDQAGAPDYYEIMGQRFNADGTPSGTATPLNELSSGYQYDPDITVLAGDRYVATWESNSSGVNDGSSYGVLYRVFEANGTPVTGQMVANTTTTNSQLDGVVTALDDGGFLIAWVDRNGTDGSGYGIFAQRFDVDGTAVGAEFQVNSLTSGTQDDVSVTTLADGNLVFTWADNGADLSGQGVYAQIYDVAGNPINDQFRVNDRTSSTQYQPDVQALDTGGFVIAWADSGGDGSSYGVYGQQYDANGNRLDSQFLVNTTTSGSQDNPAIAALIDGGFAIGWEGSVDVQVYGNDLPVNSPVSATGDEDVALVLDETIFDAGFVDPDGNPLQAIRINSFPSNGSLTLSGVAVTAGQEISRAELVAGNLVYLGNLDYNGADSFEWSGSDGIDFATSSVLANITLNPVNDAPGLEAGADTSLGEGGTLNRQLALSDPDVQTRTLTIDWGDGSAADVFTSDSVTPNTSHSYGGEGVFTVTVTVDDGAGEPNSVETDSYVVTVINADPNANPDSISVNEDGPAATGNVLTNDSDPGGDTLIVSAINGATADVGVQISTSGGGLVTLNSDGSFSYDPNGAFEALDSFVTGTDSFSYEVSDGEGGTDTQTVTVYIDGENDDPDALDDAIPVTDDNAVTGDLLSNDTDVDANAALLLTLINGTPLAANPIVLPSGALLTVDATGAYTYDPNGQFLSGGTDTFTYTISDGYGGTDTATATVTISGTQSPPDAVDDAFSTDEDTTAAVNVLTNDTDADFDTLSVTQINGSAADVGNQVTLTGGGVVTLAADGSLSFDPDGQYNSLAVGETTTETFTYTIGDGNGGSDQATVDFTITGVNDDPLAGNDSGSTDEDTPTSGNVLSNDTDVDLTDTMSVGEVGGSTLAVGSVVTGSSGGSFVIAANGDWTYDPGTAHQYLALGQTTNDTVLYTVVDANGGADTAQLTVTITGLNDGPDAVLDSFSVSENATLTGQSLLANDTDPDTGDIPVVFAVNGATTIGSQIALASGALLVVNASGTFSYDPNGQFDALQNGETATDSFAYTIQDGSGLQDTATATITINGNSSAPVANDDLASTDEDTPTVVDVLANDSDADGDPLGVTLIDGQVPTVNVPITLTSGARVTLNGDGTLSYDPFGQYETLAPGDTTTDSFVYQISDGTGRTDTATATVTITGANDDPDARDDLIGTTEDTGVTDDLFQNNGSGVDSDIDAGDSLTVTAVNGVAGNVGNSVTLSGGGTVTVLSTGAVSFDPAAQYESLAAGETATENFTYTVSDAHGGTDTATVTVSIGGVNDDPDAVDDLFNVAVDAGVSGNVLAANGGLADSDVDASDVLSVSVIQGGTSFGTPVATNNGGLVTMLADGSFSYDQNGAFSGLGGGATATDTFTYGISDGNGGTDTATVTITIGGTNVDPVAVDDTATTDQDSVVVINPAANDTDANGDALSVISVDDTGLLGTLLLNVDGTVSYDPNGQFDGLADGATATETFTYQVSDGLGGVDGGSVTVTITGLNDGPDAVLDSFSVSENATLTGQSLLANDTDPDTGDIPVVFAVNGATTIGSQITLASGALLVVNASGTFSYDPNGQFDALQNGETATDSFAYTIQDGSGLQDTATATITINGNSSAPVANDDLASTDEDTSTVVDVLANDSDADGDPLLIVSVGPASFGTVLILGNGTIEYTPFADVNGIDEFTYTIMTADGATATASVEVTVAPEDDAPVFLSGAIHSLDENTQFVATLSATDIDGPNASSSFSIEGGADAALFDVDAVTGELTFLVAPDWEAAGSAAGSNDYEVQVGATNGALTTTMDLTITVQDVLEQPNSITGTPGRDILIGSDFEDEITTAGGRGDVVSGGAGVDVFIFTNAADGQTQQASIADYTPGEDAIDLQGTVVDFHYSWAGTTYLFMNGTDYDSLSVIGADNFNEITFV